MIGSRFSDKKDVSKNKLEYKHCSDQEIVTLCLENKREAWEEFFFRFIPVIKKSIQSRLIVCVKKKS